MADGIYLFLFIYLNAIHIHILLLQNSKLYKCKKKSVVYELFGCHAIQENLRSKLERMERQLDLCIYADEVYKDMVKHMAVRIHQAHYLH